MEKRLRLILLIAGVVLLVLAGLGGGLLIANRKNTQKMTNDVVPASITQNLSFPIYVPTISSAWSLDTSKTNYDQQSGVLSLSLNQDTTQIILTQQATPQVFADIPQQYSKMLSTMNQYTELQTSFGTVAVTRPKELNGGQTAVSNKADTLLFAKPNRDLSDDEWKKFFNNLRLYK